jgi:hypothetical protein
MSHFFSFIGGPKQVATSSRSWWFFGMDSSFYSILLLVVILVLTLAYCLYRVGLSNATQKKIEDSALREATRIARKFPRKDKVR